MTLARKRMLETLALAMAYAAALSLIGLLLFTAIGLAGIAANDHAPRGLFGLISLSVLVLLVSLLLRSAANRVLDRAEKRPDVRLIECPSCGYDTSTLNEAAGCPECGWGRPNPPPGGP